MLAFHSPVVLCSLKSPSNRNRPVPHRSLLLDLVAQQRASTKKDFFSNDNQFTEGDVDSDDSEVTAAAPESPSSSSEFDEGIQAVALGCRSVDEPDYLRSISSL